MNKEPALIIKAFEEILRAAIPMALAFGWIHWTDVQIGTVVLFTGLVLGFISLLVTRSQVVPTQTANAQIETAIKGPSTATVGTVIADTAAKEK